MCSTYQFLIFLINCDHEQARAKVELRMTATANDARDVLEIFEASLSSAFDDEVIAVSALSDSIVLSQAPSGKSQSFRTQVGYQM